MIQSVPAPQRFAILWHSMPPAAPAVSGEGGNLAGEESPVRSLPSIAVRTSHFDLLLQADEAALTWELPRLPMQGESLPVQRLADHRLHYLDYEGPLSDNRGQVVAWDRGRLIWQLRGDGRAQALLFGERLTAQLLIEAEGSERSETGEAAVPAEDSAAATGRLAAQSGGESGPLTQLLAAPGGQQLWRLTAKLWQVDAEA